MSLPEISPLGSQDVCLPAHTTRDYSGTHFKALWIIQLRDADAFISFFFSRCEQRMNRKHCEGASTKQESNKLPASNRWQCHWQADWVNCLWRSHSSHPVKYFDAFLQLFHQVYSSEGSCFTPSWYMFSKIISKPLKHPVMRVCNLHLLGCFAVSVNLSEEIAGQSQ